MPVLTIDKKEFELDQLSDDAKAQLAMLQFVDSELKRFSIQTAVLQTARLGYARALNEMLVTGKKTK